MKAAAQEALEEAGVTAKRRSDPDQRIFQRGGSERLDLDRVSCVAQAV